MREMQRGRRLNVILGLEKIVFILGFFFLSAGWLNRFGSVRFNRFFNRLIRFFFRFGFFGYFFSGFLGLIGLSVFLLTPTCYVSSVGLQLQSLSTDHLFFF